MNDLPLWVTIPSTLLLVLSGTMTLIGSAGLLRFRRFYSRMHAVTLGNTMGAGCVVLTSVLVASTLAHRPVMHELLIIMFLVIVSPVTAILLMQAALRRDARRPVSED
ncbi:monovalent cation/H(+) antiporter subunit G [Pusillimonas sp.]|uniref:monovalent cation/H(+) antiporter subunit G n=1 Tax=Pusillimonas sp. TaxID=3040095 RepID=UPI0029AA6E53|nr:monovalent cation/H(+) antiporter subunit G [Pusillimonas sp.]MDX3893956.1 monovalent cation/H(+) antiporter subunit G [Pusillimonas sp.]